MSSLRGSLQVLQTSLYYGALRHSGASFQALVGCISPLTNTPILIEFDPECDFELKDSPPYCFIGSGELQAAPFAKFVHEVILNKEEVSLENANLAVYRVLRHTIDTAPQWVGDPIVLGSIWALKSERGYDRGSFKEEVSEEALGLRQKHQELNAALHEAWKAVTAPAQIGDAKNIP